MMGKATTGKDGKFIAPPGTAECFPEVSGVEAGRPNGADRRKTCWPALASSVETTFGKQKARRAKKKP